MHSLRIVFLLAGVFQFRQTQAALQRIVAVGDYHGDYPQVAKVLRMAGIIDSTGAVLKAMQPTVFVQTGDVVDRGPDTIALFELMQRLYNGSTMFHSYQESSASGLIGMFPLLGNHEIMNLQGDLRYVTAEDYASFGGREARRAAWSSQGWLGELLFTTFNNVTAIVNGSVFVHGGITSEWAQLGVDGLNNHVHNALKEPRWRDSVFGSNGPFWYRGYALENEDVVCKPLKKALKLLKAKRMIIGHTPQLESKEILSRCNGQVFVIDVGISSAYGANCAALEIVGDIVTALYCVPGKPDEARRVDLTPKLEGLNRSLDDNEL
ncbi:hypothetical protein HK100_011318 [Physocladia obscura]|uniref:Calcineurin-like phosphoesterase domain-containing protein n=1 Tax=Physocladia obscura TaxID=109957 RepID=A0AAD5XID7_9FUNG|nr:hypothetical protein HK100_011318 [Physocladia obscura]